MSAYRPYIGRCPRCKKVPTDIANVVSDWTSAEEIPSEGDLPRGLGLDVFDDNYAFCLPCLTSWRTGNLLEPPALRVSWEQMRARFTEVRPLDVEDGCAAAFWANYINDEEDAS